MKHLLLLIGILFLACAVCAETSTNSATTVYPTETAINVASTVYPTETTIIPTPTPGNWWDWLFPTPTPETTLEPTVVQTETVTPQTVTPTPPTVIPTPTIAAPVILIPVTADVRVSDGSQVYTKQYEGTTSLQIDIISSGIKKVAQVEPEIETVFSPDGLTMMQTSLTSRPALQVYYGYRSDASHPFSQLYKVDSVDCDPCTAYRTDFNARTMIGKNVAKDKILAIIDSGVIPAYEALP